MTFPHWNFPHGSGVAMHLTSAGGGSSSDRETKGLRTNWHLGICYSALCVLSGILGAQNLSAQSADEHASHHPTQAGEALAAPSAMGMPATNAGSPGPPAMAGGAGGMGAMGEMMKGMMGAPKTKELYPSLMDLPDLPLSKRRDVETQAVERMRSGTSLMNEGLDQLLQASITQKFASMQSATASLREGLARYESGLAAQRALAEGKAPRNVALTWFKREMSLVPLTETSEEHAGLTVFHMFVMGLLTAFFVVMSGMYFFKMRRASALLQRIADGGPLSAPAVADPVARKEPVTAPQMPPVTPKAEAGPDAKKSKAEPIPGSPASAVKAPATADANATASPEKPKVVGAAPAAKVSPAAAPPAQGAGPVSRNWKGILRVNRIFDETPGVKTFRFTAMDGGPIPFTYLPGQYLSVLPFLSGIRTARSYTIASSPTQKHYCELTIKREDKGRGVSRYFHDGLQEGELIEVSGPSGTFTFTGKESKSVVLIGGGVGITPLMSYVRYLTDSGWPGDVFMLFTFRHASDYIFRGELEALCVRHPKLHLVVTISRPNTEPWNGLTGRFTKEVIAQAVPEIATRLVYVCGPDTMMKAVQGALLELDVPTSQVKTEAFSAPQSGVAGDKPKAPAPPDVSDPAGVSASPLPQSVTSPTLTAGAQGSTSPPPDAGSVSGPATGESPSPPEPGAGSLGETATVDFTKSKKSSPLAPDVSILEASEAVGVNIDFECRVGTCGRCKVTLLSGAVTMEVEDALSAAEKAKGVILACQAKSTGNCSVEA